MRYTCQKQPMLVLTVIQFQAHNVASHARHETSIALCNSEWQMSPCATAKARYKRRIPLVDECRDSQPLRLLRFSECFSCTTICICCHGLLSFLNMSRTKLQNRSRKGSENLLWTVVTHELRELEVLCCARLCSQGHHIPSSFTIY